MFSPELAFELFFYPMHPSNPQYVGIDNFQSYFYLLQLDQEEKKEEILSLVQMIFRPRQDFLTFLPCPMQRDMMNMKIHQNLPYQKAATKVANMKQ